MAEPENTNKNEVQAAGLQISPAPAGLQIPIPAGLQITNLEDLLKHAREETARKLSGWLVFILAGGIALHYGCYLLLTLLKRGDAVAGLEDAFHAWLPVVSGLAGGAATYYFTREGR